MYSILPQLRIKATKEQFLKSQIPVRVVLLSYKIFSYPSKIKEKI